MKQLHKEINWPKVTDVFIYLFYTHIFPCIHPSNTLRLHIIDYTKQRKGYVTVDVLLTFPPDMTEHRTSRTSVDVLWVFTHSENANTPGVPELTATLSHILCNMWDTEAPFVSSTHTVLTHAHSANLTK